MVSALCRLRGEGFSEFVRETALKKAEDAAGFQAYRVALRETAARPARQKGPCAWL